MTSVVIYRSVYGTTKKYAEWIAKELDAPLVEASQMKPAQLMEYDVVIYGGGLYAGGIIGAKLVAKNPCKSLLVFTVGLATPEITDYSDILKMNFSKEALEKMKIFHFQGGIDYKRLGMVHRAMMAVKKKEAEKVPSTKRSNDDLLFLETYGGKVDYTNREAIKPLIDYVRNL